MTSGGRLDAELARRDPAVPGLALALDPEALLARLVDLLPPGAAPDALALPYVRYKPGTGVVGALEVRGPAGPGWGFVKAVAPRARGKLDAVLRADGPEESPAGTVPVVVDEDHALVLAPASRDRRLPGAAALLDPGSGHPRPRILRYKPERRLVARRGDRLVKLHRPDAVPAIVAAHAALEAAGPTPDRPTVTPLGPVDRDQGWVEHAWVDGWALDRQPRTPDLLAEVGALLAAVHRTAPGAVAPGPPAATLAHEAVEAIAVLDPGLRARAQRVADGALGALGATDPVATVVHGDFSADQVLRTPGGLVLLDLDRVCLDEPAADLAGWAADRVAATARLATGDVVDLAALDPAGDLPALVAGYRRAGGSVDEGRLAARTALAVLARAVEPFRFRHPDWPRQVTALVGLAARLAGGPVAA